MKTINKIPIIGLGTWRITEPNTPEIVRTALRVGYTHIDTAQHYGNEHLIGQGIKGFDRKKLFITSKVWRDYYSYEGVLKACHESLNKLGIDYLDLFLIHWPDKNADYREMFKAFKQLIDEKKIKAFGVSNYTIRHLEKAMKLAKEFGLNIANNQIEFHPLLYQKELLDFCKKNNIVVTAYSPLAHGELLSNKILKKIADKYGKTTAQISIRWLLDKGMVVIPKSTSENHLRENLDMDFELNKEYTEEIDNLNENTRTNSPDYNEF